MSGDGLRIDIDGHSETLAVLAAVAARAEHPRAMFEDIGAALVTSTQRRFEQGRAPDGNPWPPSLRALATGGKTLIESARLMQSITFNASDTRVEVGTNVEYAAIHQRGGTIDQPARSAQVHFKTHKRTGARLKGFRRVKAADEHRNVVIPAHQVHMPARPFLGIDDDDERAILVIAERFFGGTEARP